MQHRAFTLIEMMVAITVLLLLVGLVAFGAIGQRHARDSAEACERLTAALRLGQAEARRRGGLVEVVIEHDGNERVVVLRAIEQARNRAGEIARAAASARSVAIGEAIELPSGVVIEPGAAIKGGQAGGSSIDQDGEGSDRASNDLTRESSRTADGNRDLVLAVYMPDGNAVMVTEPFVIIDKGGGQVSVTINPWIAEAVRSHVAAAKGISEPSETSAGGIEPGALPSSEGGK